MGLGRMKKSNWESKWLSLGPGSWETVLDWCLKTRTRKRERGRESPKLAEKLENDNSSTAFT